MSEIVGLALDISLRRTGWVVGSPSDRRPQKGTIEFPEWSDKTKIDIVLKLWRFLEGIHLEYELTDIAYEMPFIDPKAFNLTLLKVQDTYETLIWLFCALNKVRCAKAPIASWRDRFLGLDAEIKARIHQLKPHQRTKFYKDAAMKACADRGWPVSFHDEAEAHGILDFLFCVRDPIYAGKTDVIFRRADLQNVRKAPEL